jgi:phosphodiesterase/alkaline phosphatase D-like protein
MTDRPPLPETTELAGAVAVGSADDRSVRIWVRAPNLGAGRLVFLLQPPDGLKVQGIVARRPDPQADHTLVFTYPDDFPSVPDLRPSTRYQFRVETSAGDLIGEGGFDTPPTGLEDTPDRFCFAFGSCHQPFDKDGQPGEEALTMLAAAEKALAAHGAKFLLMLGDQVYADEPAVYSVHGAVHNDDRLQSALQSASAEEIRARYQQQYRRSWAVPGYMRLQSQRATYCTPDDHEIVDNWGSAPEHAAPSWQRVATGALQACFDYQGARSWPGGSSRPASLARWFGHGTIAVFLMDVRSERQAVPGQERVISEAQIEALEAFLKANRHRHALFIATGVPIVHIPGWLSRVGETLAPRGNDLHDRWSHPPFLPQRDRILATLAQHRQAHPQQQMALLAGDIHAGWAATLRPAGGKPLIQFTSSALTNHDASMAGVVARALVEVTRPLEREVAGLLVAGLEGTPGSTNPYGGLNLGIVEIEKIDNERSRVRFKLIGQDRKDPSKPRVVFESAPTED